MVLSAFQLLSLSKVVLNYCSFLLVIIIVDLKAELLSMESTTFYIT